MKNLKVENCGMVDIDRNAQRTQIERIGALMRNGSADRRGSFAAMCELTPIAEGLSTVRSGCPEGSSRRFTIDGCGRHAH